ncbi:hypothetical protein ACA544_02460 [Vibrio cholerae]|uniref:hypothetical protein n=1 Tax=Vibrio cholerae TaxID=666 RepID=UPI000E698323|nr:hypothetical protein [Vibrio cholerae]
MDNSLKTSLLALVDRSKLQKKIAEANEHEEFGGMVPSVFAYKTLEGDVRVGFNYQPMGTKVGYRFHIDHGVGIHRNTDGEVLWVKENITITKEIFA